MTVWWVSWTTNPSPCSRPVLPLLFIISNLSSSSPVGLGCINHFSPFSLSIGSFPSTYKHAQISATWKKKFWLTLNFLLITRLAFLCHDCFLKEKLYSLFLFPHLSFTLEPTAVLCLPWHSFAMFMKRFPSWPILYYLTELLNWTCHCQALIPH